MAQPIEEIKKFREKKLKNWQEAGFNPFPERVDCKYKVADLLKKFNQYKKGKKLVSLCGRVISFRDQGRIVFLDLKDETGKVQVVLQKDILKNYFKFLKSNLDLGDLISVKGFLFLTKKGEKSVRAKKLVLASKSLLPLPSGWYGLADIEERFRKRYLDLLINQEVKERFDRRFKLTEEIRRYLWDKGFLEVETPILQPLWGGANAKPFVTHHNALDIDLYLRIAPELYLKRLVVGGYEKIFEIGRNFRNEGIDKEHNPEFSMLELYWAWQDLEGLKKFTQKFIKDLVKKFFKGLKVKWQGVNLDFSNFREVDIVQLVKKETGIDFDKDSKEEIVKKVQKIDLELEKKTLLNIKDKELTTAVLFDAVFKKVCRPKIIQPTFVFGHPWEISPLAKRDPKNKNRVLRFQLIVAGMEIVNAFSELNNPKEQEARFREQERLRKTGDDEAQQFDKDFVEALEYGMPPTAGMGVGIDRLAMIFTNAANLKEVILFPLLKQKKDD